eukprot:scaffold62431_cov75-Attheya_sp.AAC.2
MQMQIRTYIAYASSNINCMSVTLETSHALRCINEHGVHGCDTGNIPTKGIIKSIQIFEAFIYISYFTYIPACDIAAID